MTQQTTPRTGFPPRWATEAHPVFGLELRRQRRNRGLSTVQGCFAPVLFGVTGLAVVLILVLILPIDFSWSAESAITTTLLVSMVVLMIIQLIGGAFANIMVLSQVSPAISGEVELQSWRLLRTTTLTAREIVFAKLSAILISLRPFLSGLIVIRLISTITALILYTFAVRDAYFYSFDPDEILAYVRGGLWLPTTLATLAVVVSYASQPVVQFLLSGAIGLAASALTRARAQSAVTALSWRLALWVAVTLVNIGSVVGLSLLISSWQSPDYGPLQVFRGRPMPTELEATWGYCLAVSGFAIAVLAWQTGLILTALGYVLRRARHLEV